MAVPLLSQAKSADIPMMDSLKKVIFHLARQGNFEEALKVNYYYLKIAEKNKDTCRICEIYSRASITYDQMINWVALERNVDIAERFCLRCSDLVLLGVWTNSKARQYFLRENYDSAIALYTKASQIFFKANKSVLAYEALAHMDAVYERINKPELATQHILNFYNHTKEVKNRNFQLKATHKLASHYNLLKDGKNALKYAHEACDIAWERMDKWHIASALQNEAKAYYHLKNYTKSQQLYEEFIRFYKDSVIRQERLDAVERLTIEFETSKKEAKISNQENQLRNQQKILLFSALFLALTLGAFLIYYNLSQKLKSSNTQKEFLIKEIHHRVKNNLQLLSSLLYLQSKHVKDENALKALQESQNRAEAMGIIHQRLYTNNNLSTMNLNEYVDLLSSSLLASFGMKSQVQINNYAEQITIEVDPAIQIGLILNELITNSLKHAFPNKRDGQIDIIIQKKSAQSILLSVHDNGVGMNPNFNSRNGGSFGTDLVGILAKKLNGTIRIDKTNGYRTDIIFENISTNNNIN